MEYVSNCEYVINASFTDFFLWEIPNMQPNCHHCLFVEYNSTRLTNSIMHNAVLNFLGARGRGRRYYLTNSSQLHKLFPNYLASLTNFNHWWNSWSTRLVSHTLRVQSPNPLRAKLFREYINIYLHFVSYLHIDTTLVVEIIPQIRQEPTYFT